MAEYAQMPVSLIERLITTATTTGVNIAAAREARALLSQPTPTAEPDRCPACRHSPHAGHVCLNMASDKDCVCTYIAEPPRIEDMAPGTTFTAGVHGIRRNERRRWVYLPSHSFPVIDVDNGAAYRADGIDPSTIREVTPPKDAA